MDSIEDLVANGMVYLGDGNGFQSAIGTKIGTDLPQSIVSVTSADIDGDGKTDLIVAYRSGPSATHGLQTGVKFYLNPGNGDFSSASSTHVGAPNEETQTVTVVDVNGDGKLDIVTGNKFSTNKIYLNSVTTLPGTPVFPDTGHSIQIGSDTDDTKALVVAGEACEICEPPAFRPVVG